MGKIIGIDVSKQTLDVAFQTENEVWEWLDVSNDPKGFKKLFEKVGKEDTVVMEASGPYYLQVAVFLHEREVKVCVENPLVIKRYSQMLLQRAKTDRKDAQVIARYGMVHSPKQWKPDSETNLRIKQAYSGLELVKKQINQTKVQLHAFESTGVLDKELKKDLKGIIKHLERKAEKLEERINGIAELEYKGLLDRLQTIPGIGKKTAMLLAVLTDGFRKFDHYKQLIAYVGFSPRIYQSGTSVRGKGHICKMGKSQIRKLLYMCSWTAKKANRFCKEMYDRLKQKGKPERVIKIAIANKLIKQAFAIAKNETTFDKNYSKNVCF